MTRARVLLPPKGWRPPPLTPRVKVDVVIRQRAMCACDRCRPYIITINGVPPVIGEAPATALPLRDLTHTIFDHRPPVHEREWLPHLNDTLPSANDPKYVRAVDVDHDRPVTVADGHRMRKVNRVRADEDTHADYMADKQPGQKRGRQSRSFR